MQHPAGFGQHKKDASQEKLKPVSEETRETAASMIIIRYSNGHGFSHQYFLSSFSK